MCRHAETILVGLPIRARCWLTYWLLGGLSLLAPPLAAQQHPALKKLKTVALKEIDRSDEIINRPRPAAERALKPRPDLNFELLKGSFWSSRAHTLGGWLSIGADPNTQDKGGSPILFTAIWHGKPDDVIDLLQAGADPNLTRAGGETPLQFAIYQGDIRHVEALLRYGADPKLDSRGKSPREWAEFWSRKQMFPLFDKKWEKFEVAPRQLPKLVRQPTAVFGSRNWSCPRGGQALIYTPDSKHLIAGDREGAIRIYDAATGQVQAVLDGGGEILGLALVPNSRILVSAGYDRFVRFWDLDTLAELKRLQLHTGQGKSLAVSPDGRWLSTGSHTWRIESTNPLQLAPTGRTEPTGIAYWGFFTSDSKYLVTKRDENYWIWDVANDKHRLIGELADRKTPPLAITWGDLAATVDIGREPPLDPLALIAAQYTAVVASPAHSQAAEKFVREQASNSRAIACSPNGQFVAAVGFNSRIAVFDLKNRRSVSRQGHGAGLQGVAGSPDGKWIATGSDDKTVRIWNRDTREEAHVVDAATYIYSVRFSPDSKLLAIGDNGGAVYLYDLATRSVRHYGVPGRITDLVFDPDGEYLAVVGFELHIVDLKTGQLRAKISADSSQQGRIAINPLTKLIVGTAMSMAAGETFKVPNAWSLDGNQLFAHHKELFDESLGHRTFIDAVAFSPNGRLLAASSSGAIRLWDMKEKKPVSGPLMGHIGSINELRFSSTGKWLASCSDDGTARVWEVATGRQAYVLDADVNGITGVDVLPTGEIVTANWDCTAHLWKLPGVGP